MHKVIDDIKTGNRLFFGVTHHQKHMYDSLDDKIIFNKKKMFVRYYVYNLLGITGMFLISMTSLMNLQNNGSWQKAIFVNNITIVVIVYGLLYSVIVPVLLFRFYVKHGVIREK